MLLVKNSVTVKYTCDLSYHLCRMVFKLGDLVDKLASILKTLLSIIFLDLPQLVLCVGNPGLSALT